MSGTARALPLRLARWSAARNGQWICKRCIVTEANATSTHDSPSLLNLSAGADQSTILQRNESRQAWIEKWIAKELPHRVPIQYLQHCKSVLLPTQEQEWRTEWPAHGKIIGVVVSAGKMDKTVKVRIPGQRWEKRIRKYFSSPTDHLVHDPRNSLREGDVVNLHRLRVSSVVHHVVADIISAFGTPVDERPTIPTPEERLAEYKFQRFQKLHRRALRVGAERGKASAIERLQAMGLSVASRQQTSGKGGSKSVAGKLPTASDAAAKTGKVNARALRNRANELGLKEQAKLNQETAKTRERELEGVVGTTLEAGVMLTRGRGD